MAVLVGSCGIIVGATGGYFGAKAGSQGGELIGSVIYDTAVR